MNVAVIVPANQDDPVPTPFGQNNMCSAGQVIGPSRLWYVVGAMYLFTWALSTKLSGTLGSEQQVLEAALIWFLACITISAGILVLIKYGRLKRDDTPHTKPMIHLHLRVFYSIFAVMIGVMQSYWIVFKIVFRQCDRIVDVDFTQSSGQVLYYGQIAYAFASVVFAITLWLWLSQQQRFPNNKYNQVIHHIVVATLLAKTCYVYIDEARIMVEHITKPDCHNNERLLTGHNEILNCTPLQNSRHFDLYAKLYNANEQLLEPLQYAASSEGLTTFLVVLILLRRELQDNSGHDNEHDGVMVWRNVMIYILRTIRSHKKVAICFMICIAISWCLSSGVLVIFVPLFMVDEGNIGSLWSKYLIVRMSICTLLAVTTTISVARHLKINRHEAKHKMITTTDRLDINLLFYSMVFGPIPQTMLSAFASIVLWSSGTDCSASRQHNIMQSFESATNLIQAISQYIFIATVVEFKTYKNKSSSSLAEAGVVSMLMVFQLIMWIANIGSKHIINKIDRSGHDYYPATFWGVAMAVMYPSAVFFRAHAFILCGTILFGYLSTFSSIQHSDEQQEQLIENEYRDAEYAVFNQLIEQHDYRFRL